MEYIKILDLFQIKTEKRIHFKSFGETLETYRSYSFIILDIYRLEINL